MMWIGVEPFAAQFFRPLEHPAIFERQAFQRHTQHFTFRLRDVLTCLLTILTDALGHVTGMEESIVIGVYHRQERIGLSRQPGHFIVRMILSLASPLAAAFLDNPESHDVLG